MIENVGYALFQLFWPEARVEGERIPTATKINNETMKIFFMPIPFGKHKTEYSSSEYSSFQRR